MFSRLTHAASIQRAVRSTGSSLLRQQQGAFSSIIGIDLGTTNSAVAVYEGTAARICENSEGTRTTPSVVSFSKKEGKVERLVGSPAKRQAVTNPKNTFYATKRLIGRQFDEEATTDIAKHLSFEVVKGDTGDAWVRCETTGKNYSPAQIGSFVLQKMRETAEDSLGTKVTDAIVTVPAYFNDSQRQATKDAGEIAGLNVKRVLNEPTAAAMAFGLGGDGQTGKRDGIVAVYDFGGGTFDISILSLSDGVFEVMSTNGDTALGGEDLDHALLQFIADEFKREHQIDLMQDPLAVQRLKELAEKSKVELSSTTQSHLALPFITSDSTGPKHLDMQLSRAKLESLVQKFLDKTIPPCEQALKDADIARKDITDVILVGGTTRMPKVQELVERFFEKPPSKSVNPDEVVAMGAAIQGGILSGDHKDLVLIDVTPLSLGIETLGGVFTALIEKNTAIPVGKSEVFSTAADNQTQVGIKVYQGEREMACDNKFLGHFDLVGIPPAPRGRPQIEVGFDIDANGILNVSAKDKGTGKDQQMQVQTSGGLTKEEIEKMKTEAAEMADEDKKKREVAEVKNSADTVTWQVEDQMEEHKEKISDELRGELTQAISDVRSKRESDDIEGLKASVEALNKLMSKIGEAIYSGNPKSEEGASSDSAEGGEESTADAGEEEKQEGDKKDA